MMKRCIVLALWICGVTILLFLTRTTSAADKPNIIMVLTDDQGWMDSGAYGSKYYKTPNMDRLASMGVRFSDAYSASPLCSPTRLSVLTGKYPHRLGMTAPVGHLPTLPANRPLFKGKSAPWQAYLTPDSRRELPNNVLTYGKVFKAAGYATAFMGKWHLGKPPYMPENHGFDLVVGGRGNPGPPGGFFAPWRSDTLPNSRPGTHIDDAITDEALGFITEHKDGSFLINLWFYGVHAPFEAKQNLIDKYKGLADSRGKQDCPVMGAMLETVDENLGRVLDKIEELGIADNTIIIFWSDNGGNMYNDVDGTTPTNNAPLKMGKGNIHEGGIRVPAMVVWPGVTKPGSVSDQVVSTIDIFPTLIDMAGMKTTANEPFDGTTLRPALAGHAIERDTIFFHFPHYVPKPSNMSASAVRQGDYKLIRRYDRDGEAPYRYELYNLKDDIGESKNLANTMPDKVKKLDTLIAEHLTKTRTPVPPANPAFVQGSYNPITGKGDRNLVKSPKAGDKPASNAEIPKGWRPGGMTKIKFKDGNLVVTSTNTDPWVMCHDLPKVQDAFIARARIKLQTYGSGEFFWASRQNPGFQGRGVPFDLKHDGQWHEYEVKIPANGELTNFRIDPGRAAGEVLIDWIEIQDAEGKAIKRWSFDQ